MRTITFTKLNNCIDVDTNQSPSLPPRKFLSQFEKPIVGKKKVTKNTEKTKEAINETKRAAPAYIMATFGKELNHKKHLRHDNNVISCTGIVLDIDNKDNDYLSFSKANGLLKKLLKPCSYAIHTTISHTKEKNKFRVIIPFSHPISPERLWSIFNYFSKKLQLGDTVDKCSYSPSHPFTFPVCMKGQEQLYKVHINSKGKQLFDPKIVPASYSTPFVKKPKKNKRSSKTSTPVSTFVPVKVRLNTYPIDASVKNIIKTGDTSNFTGDRSDAGFHVVSHLIEKKLSDDVIASIVLKPSYGISERFIEKGVQWTLDEIARIREKLVFSRKRIFNDIEPHYPLADEVSVKRASRVMHKHIKKWLQRNKYDLGLKLPAGIGKTEEYIDFIAHSDAKLIEVYVPTHKLGNDCRQRLIDKGVNPNNVTVIQGRTYHPEDGTPLCRKYKAAEKFGESGVSTYKSLCRNDAGEQCEYFEGCPYLAQYKPSTQVRIYTHAHLPLKRGLLDKELPDFAIIYESFWKEMIDEKTTSLENISYYINSSKLANCINNALKKNKPLLQCLRLKYGDDIEKVINKAIKSISRHYPDIQPNESEEQITSALTPEFKKSRIIELLLQQLLAELNLPQDRDNSITVRYNGKKVSIANRKTMTRFTTKQDDEGGVNHVPVLCADANFCKDIVKLFLPGIKSKTVHVKRKAVVTQIHSNTGAKSRYIPYGNVAADSKIATNCNKHLEDVQQVINNLNAQHSKLLVVTYKALLKPKDGLPMLTIPKGCESIHFGGLRGIDTFSDCDAILVIGRQQLPVHAVESIAACLWWDSDNELKLTGERHQEVRGYRLVNGDKKGVKVMCCEDPRAQMVMEQLRECESLQAVDRVRLMHNDVKKHVYLMSNLPLDIDVDNLIKWKDMVSGGSRIEQILASSPNIVLSTSPLLLHVNYPEYFSISVAKKEAALIQKLAELSDDSGYCFNSAFLNKQFNLWPYRIIGTSGRNLTAIADDDKVYAYVLQELEKTHQKSILLKTRNEQ